MKNIFLLFCISGGNFICLYTKTMGKVRAGEVWADFVFTYPHLKKLNINKFELFWQRWRATAIQVEKFTVHRSYNWTEVQQETSSYWKAFFSPPSFHSVWNCHAYLLLPLVFFSYQFWSELTKEMGTLCKEKKKPKWNIKLLINN